MRLIRISTNYPAYLRDFYGARPGLEQATYAEQYRSLVDNGFGWTHNWTQVFGKLGYEVWEPVANAEPMQRAWAREQGVSCAPDTWLTDITAAQIRHFKPDVLFVNDYSTFSEAFLRSVRESSPSIRLVLGWCGAPYRDPSVFRAYDVVLSCIPGLVDHFRLAGHQSVLVRHAFDPRVLERLDVDADSSIDFSFVGSIVKGNGFHNNREELLKHLVREANIEIWADARLPTAEHVRRLRLRRAAYDAVKAASCLPGAGPILRRLPKVRTYHAGTQRPSLSGYVDPVLAPRVRPGLFGLSMYQHLHDSKVTLNTHIDIAASYASNMRLFEATGVGTCLLTDAQPDLHEVFEPEVEVVTYRSADEAVERVRYLLDHDEERRSIAKAGQSRTLREHTFDLRARQIADLIQQHLS